MANMLYNNSGSWLNLHILSLMGVEHWWNTDASFHHPKREAGNTHTLPSIHRVQTSCNNSNLCKNLMKCFRIQECFLMCWIKLLLEIITGCKHLMKKVAAVFLKKQLFTAQFCIVSRCLPNIISNKVTMNSITPRSMMWSSFHFLEKTNRFLF